MSLRNIRCLPVYFGVLCQYVDDHVKNQDLTPLSLKQRLSESIVKAASVGEYEFSNAEGCRALASKVHCELEEASAWMEFPGKCPFCPDY